MSNEVINLSVHQLVDFLLRTGDIDNRVFNRSTMQEGTRLHSLFQRQQDMNYQSEYYLRQEFFVQDIKVVLEGRADGITKRLNGSYVVDEIKTTIADLEEFKNENYEWHMGQAKCYAFMLACEQGLQDVEIRIVYIRQGKEKDRLIVREKHNVIDLKHYVYSLIDEYLDFYNITRRYKEIRDESIKALEFPFPEYRLGQRELTKYCYGIALNGGRLFCEAPTGIGKTISVLYPFIKSLPDNSGSTIFYLTAKNTGKEAAVNALNMLKEKGLRLKSVVLTAKEKICPYKGKACNPDECPLTVGYYKKNKALLAYCLENHDSFYPDFILQIANEYQVCPFEFQLDLSLYCDAIVCDYNYVFDPISYLQRYVDTENFSNTLLLVDESHNLVERSKDMYSASLSLNSLLEVKKSLSKVKHLKLKTLLRKIQKYLEVYKQEEYISPIVLSGVDAMLLVDLDKFQNLFLEISKEQHEIMTKELKDFSLEVRDFISIYQLFDSRYILFVDKTDNDIKLRLSCLDASEYLQKVTDSIKGSVFFSATLSPSDYFIKCLGGDKKYDSFVRLNSPFPKENLKVVLAPKVSIKYKNRELTYSIVKEYIDVLVSKKVGNYFIYCPSYEYLERIVPLFDDFNGKIHVQNRDMTDSDKTMFLENFKANPEETNLGFVVIGGAFGEGVDLVSDRLIGAVIIGVGLQRINFVSDKTAEFFNEEGLDGFAFAYTNPGMNKITQAVGRVIRSENDRGVVLFIDERYMYSSYRSLFKSEWENYEVALSTKDLEKILNNFY